MELDPRNAKRDVTPQHYRCTYNEAKDEIMFTVGEIYSGHFVNSRNTVVGVRDNLGHIRYIPVEEKHFLVDNIGSNPQFAYFKDAGIPND